MGVCKDNSDLTTYKIGSPFKNQYYSTNNERNILNLDHFSTHSYAFPSFENIP